MLAYIARRMVLACGTILAISIVSFLIIQLPPGDYLTAYIATLRAQGDAVSMEQVEALRKQYGLDRPIMEQYGLWMWNMLHGDFGVSLDYNRPVSELIGERLFLTVVVTLSAVIFTWALAIPIGIYSAVRQHSAGDYVFTFIGFIGVAIPGFLLALVLMYGAYAWFGISVDGLFSDAYIEAEWSLARVGDLLTHLWVPALVLGAAGTAQLIRILRSNLLDELRKPYVVAARAKGLSLWRAVIKYPVRVALNPLVSTVGYILPALVSGSVIVSVVLNLPTVGPLLWRALLAQDMYLAGTIVLLLSTLTVIGTLLSDILLVILDPRIRLEGRR
ncbi:MAG: ABC transporter permease [Planctomycetota bacterium]